MSTDWTPPAAHSLISHSVPTLQLSVAGMHQENGYEGYYFCVHPCCSYESGNG